MRWEPETADPKVGSFLPYLKWAVQNTRGPILELGSGYFSTTYLASTGRELVTYEFDPVWAEAVREEFSHKVVTDFARVPLLRWAVALVDCEGWSRHKFFRNVEANVFVLHDSQDPWIPESAFAKFVYRADFDQDPRTTLVSNILDVRQCR